MFFVFSLLWACANGIFSIKAIGGGIRLCAHYVIMLIATMLCLLLPFGVVSNAEGTLDASKFLVGAVLFTVLYFAVMGIRYLIGSAFKKNAETAKEYEKQFSKKQVNRK
jgi:p-aminobenzoyl-glutamate transporter AbgT